MAALDTSTTSIMGSESNIYNMKLTEASTSEVPSNLKTHNSDSEIMRLLIEERNGQSDEKVLFTLGDDTTLVNLNPKTLVKLSSNNEDECANCLDENVKRICSEIETFCSSNVEIDKHDTKEIHEGFDVAKHMDGEDIAKYMEKKTSDVEHIDMTCETCDVRDVCDLACAKNVTEVIVIPSAEASIDTGQMESSDLIEVSGASEEVNQ